MRRLALVLVCVGVCVNASVAAPAPEEDMLFEAPKKEAVKRDHKAADKNAANKKTAGKTINRKASNSLASAHRLLTKAPPVPAAPTGLPSFYAGVHAGAGWAHFSSDGGTEAGHASGIIGGGQFGWNYQVDHYVVGVEADISASGVRDSITGTLGGAAVTGSVRNDWFATVAARFGYASGRTLSYFKAGGACTRYKWEFANGVG